MRKLQESSGQRDCNLGDLSYSVAGLLLDYSQKRGKGGGIIDYYKDGNGNIWGFLPDIIITPEGGYVDPGNGGNDNWNDNWNDGWDNLWGPGQGNDFSDMINPGGGGNGAGEDSNLKDIERGREFVNQIAEGNVPIKVSPGIQQALDVMDGVSKAETVASLVPTMVGLVGENPNLLTKIGKATGVLNIGYGIVTAYISLTDGEQSPQDWVNAASVLASGLSFVHPAFGLVSVALMVTAAALPGDKGNGQNSGGGGY